MLCARLPVALSSFLLHPLALFLFAQSDRPTAAPPPSALKI